MLFKQVVKTGLLVLAIIAAQLTLSATAQTLTTTQQAPAEEKPTRVVTRGIYVGGGQKVDVHAPISTKKKAGLFQLKKRAPVLLYVHGGGWIKGTREKIYTLDKYATNRGYILVAIDYRPVPKTNIDGQVTDVVRAINWVRNNISKYGGDKNKIVIMGHSAGSHLVSMVAAKRVGGRLSGVIANDVQAYDMVAYGAMRGSLPYVYASAFGSNPLNWIRWSPVTYVRKGQVGGFPPIMIMYSGSNYARRKVLANGFAADLKAKGARVTLFDGKNYTHGSIARGIGSSPQVTRAVDRFLQSAFR